MILPTDGEEHGGLRAVATPGHAADHVCFLTPDGVCFSGDLVLGEGSTFVPPDGGSLAAYMDSLRRLQAEPLELICPGHGPWVTDPAAKLAEYVEHREMRERRLRRGAGARRALPRTLLAEVWDDVPDEIRPVAARRDGGAPPEARRRRPPSWPAGQLTDRHSPCARVPRRRLAAARPAGLDPEGEARAPAGGPRGLACSPGSPGRAWRRPPRPPSGSGWRGGRCRSRRGRSSWRGWRGRCGCGATAGAFPTSRPSMPADLWFAEGFCHGQDRLWQLDFYRRVVCGRLAEIAGAEGLPARPADARRWASAAPPSARPRRSSPSCAPCWSASARA